MRMGLTVRAAISARTVKAVRAVVSPPFIRMRRWACLAVYVELCDEGHTIVTPLRFQSVACHGVRLYPLWFMV